MSKKLAAKAERAPMTTRSGPAPIRRTVLLLGYRFGNQTMSSARSSMASRSAATTDGTLTSVNRFEKGPREELLDSR